MKKNIIQRIIVFGLILPLLAVCGGAYATNSISVTEVTGGLSVWKTEHKVDEETCFIFSDAAEWNSIEDFYREVERKFHVPNSLKILNFHCYLDRIRNLYWFKPTKIVWLIVNLSKFTKQKDKSAGEDIIETFEEYVLPYWEGIPGTHSVVDCCPGESARQFNVYYT